MHILKGECFMLCQSCKKKEASFHYTSNENGNVTELHLCRDCAKKSGYLDEGMGSFNPFHFFEDSDSMFGELIGGMFGNAPAKPLRESAVCPFCGMRLGEFMHGGKAGCAKCYTTFKDAITPTISKIHGNTTHVGKIPAHRALHKSKEDKRRELESLLKASIEKQEYEKAAEYRDAIRALDKDEDLPTDTQNGTDMNV